MLLTSDGEFLTGLFLPDCAGGPPPWESWRRDDDALRDARGQLQAYFAGALRTFHLALRGEGTEFQRRVWKELLAIPFGETIGYAELARRMGQPTAARAVGAANGRNPISIVVPCHRVIGADGGLVGYGGGLAAKEWLLRHEAGVVAGSGGVPLAGVAS